MVMKLFTVVLLHKKKKRTWNAAEDGVCVCFPFCLDIFHLI